MGNSLINETSPYLLQHAHNPVNWYAWRPEVFQKAKNEDKLILVSIGYSTCHWCHVMERECFENPAIASLMNEHFVCIKVDREERPDIDMVYMQAVQLMGQNGGWPLNCFCLPDGRPIYGGTYFRPEHWVNVLNSLKDIYLNDRERVFEYAEKLQAGLNHLSVLPKVNHNKVQREEFETIVLTWVEKCDHENGGPAYTPKFPMPVNLNFLLSFGITFKKTRVLDFVELTLSKLAQGGIYDQIGGGFCRYSVDGYWKIPHFEKMLYDNAQLIEIFSKAYSYFKNIEYKRVVEQTINFVNKELKSNNGLYFSALDADSEGVEGKFYVWTQEELKSILDESDYEFVDLIYNQDNSGYWEDDNFVLFRKNSFQYYADRLSINIEELIKKVDRINSILLKHRNKRIRPGVDNKHILSWNAMLVSGFVAAYQKLGSNSYLNMAFDLFKKIENYFEDDTVIYRINTNNIKSIEAYLEDYAFYLKAALDMFLCSGEEYYLSKSKELYFRINDKFYAPAHELYFFLPVNQTELITNKADTSDNVIPCGNSIMAYNNLVLYYITGNSFYYETYQKIVGKVLPYFIETPQAYAQTGLMYSYELVGLNEVVICGPQANKWYKELVKIAKPNQFLTFTTDDKAEAIFNNRFNINQTLVYICQNHTCQHPINNLNSALEVINSI